MHALARCLLVLVALAVSAAACGGPPVDLKQGLEVTVVSTGWFDAGIADGKNKLVPTISFSVKNVSDQTLVSVQMMGSFFRVSDTTSEWGNSVITVARSEGLAPGATSPVLTLRSPLGYTGTEPRDEMLQNTHFVDGMVKLVAKYGSVQWTHVKEVPIERQLITP